MQDGMLYVSYSSLNTDRLMNNPFLEPSPPFAEEPEIVIRVPATVANLLPEEKGFAGNAIAVQRLRRCNDTPDFLLQSRFDWFVGIKAQNPVTGGPVDGKVLLARETEPVL